VLGTKWRVSSISAEKFLSSFPLLIIGFPCNHSKRRIITLMVEIERVRFVKREGFVL
jgi:hypothetical protein